MKRLEPILNLLKQLWKKMSPPIIKLLQTSFRKDKTFLEKKASHTISFIRDFNLCFTDHFIFCLYGFTGKCSITPEWIKSNNDHLR